MKLLITRLAFLFILCLNGNASNTNDQIIGKWENPDRTRQIEIFKKGDSYYGKICWLKDTKEAKVKKGDIVMLDIKFTGNKWIGKIKVPAKEKAFDMEITMKDKNTINIKAGQGLISRTKIWTRIN